MADDLMENRRLQGRAAIAKKLKFSSDFRLGDTLSPKTNVWTKWHQERLVNQEMQRDVPNPANQKYIEVRKQTFQEREQNIDVAIESFKSSQLIICFSPHVR